ncbi:amino acid transporter (predicted) [Purpureocillium lavendulum]|uniref:Amino acid transporter (Predicted) n=1 Tax=Purpureocillium lavendulum TaxID=1247861 RepID=A0AB34FJQ9_9HYPO|nr:amino acid transporter (predicted) [Purpureocillium lavendulum]
MNRFACGWNYFLKYAMAAPTNLTGTSLIIGYWRPDLNVGIWITTFGVAIVIINSLHVSRVGETEFVLGCAKITIMFIMIVSCFVIAVGGGPNHDRAGFRYWTNPGAFAMYLAKGNIGRFLGFWACMCQACFSYVGIEVVGMTFGETPNPRKNVPRAIRHTFWRIAVFYVIGVLVLGMAVPSNDERLIGATKKTTSADASPFVVAMKIAGIKVFPDIINACLLVFTSSAAYVYCGSRTLYGLARDGQAPKIFGKTLKNGNPIWAVAASCAPILLGYMNASKSAGVVFQYFVSLTTIFAVLNWICVLGSYLSFRRALRAQHVHLDDLPYVALGQPWGAYYAVLISTVVVIFSGYDAFIPHFNIVQFVLKYLGNVLFVFNFLIWKFYKRTKIIRADAVDLWWTNDLAHRVVDGKSFVNTGGDEEQVWWHASEPHGTQMARLICSIDPCCERIVIKVAETRSAGISANVVAEAIRWAIGKGVDVISLSLVAYTDTEQMSAAIQEASGQDIVILSSTADEGVGTKESATDKPTHRNNKDVFTIAACDRWGNLLDRNQKVGYDYRFVGHNKLAEAGFQATVDATFEYPRKSKEDKEKS